MSTYNMFLWRNKKIYSRIITKYSFSNKSTEDPNQVLSTLMFIISPVMWAIRVVLFLFVHENIHCGYSLEAPQTGTSNEYPRVFMEKYEKCQ